MSVQEVVDSPVAKIRKPRHLKWHERQYGAGLISGIFIGIFIGIPLDAAVAILAKMFCEWVVG